MKLERLRHLSIALVAWCAAQSANADYAHNTCNVFPYDTSNNNMGLTWTLPIGDIYVPRDLPIGAAIGKFEWRATMAPEGLSLVCNRASAALPQPILYSSTYAVGPVYPGTVPSVEGHDLTGKVFMTNVKGIGVAFLFESPYNHRAENQFYTPVRLPPFANAINDFQTMPIGLTYGPQMGILVLMVKIDNVDPGVHSVAPNVLFRGDMTNIPNAYTVAVQGTVRQAQCSLDPVNPVSDVPVPLGTWSTDDFNGPGSSTAAVPFHINLVNCEDDPAGSVAQAHIRLDGALGSSVIDKDAGLFSLDSTSSARGVGVQMLQADGITPVPLTDDVPISYIVPSGAMRLPFTARFYQLDSSPLRPGSASAALAFTITYQ